MKISWSTLSELPPATRDTIQYGLAGALTGTLDGKIIIAGGSNFADKLPWLGATKLYYDAIFVLNPLQKDSVKWEQPKLKLPLKMAYTANVSGNHAMYCLGGEDAEHPLKTAFKIYFEDNQLQLKKLPELSFAVSNAGAAIIDSKIYLAGGNDSNGATKHFQMLDITNPEKGWTVLPELPEAESHSVLVSQSDGKEDCIYILGGRNKTGEISTFLSGIQKYSPTKNKWLKVGDLQLENNKKFGLSAGTGIAFSDKYILLFGGDKGKKFNKTEQLINAIETESDPIKKEKFIAEKIAHLNGHPGFSKAVLLYNTISGELKQLDEIPGESQVTTTAFLWNEKVIIPGGEIRPGVRTPLIREAKIKVE